MRSTTKYIILTATFALASCASNGHHAKKACASGCKTKVETTSKKNCVEGCKTKKAMKKNCEGCKIKKTVTKKCDACKTVKKAA